MDLQKTFKTVAHHLFEQGCPAINDATGDCAYRMADGRKCAVGILIPDAKYNAEIMEGKEATADPICEALDIEKCTDAAGNYTYTPEVLLLKDLQQIHDSVNGGTAGRDNCWGSSNDMREALQEVGSKHGLCVAFIKGLAFADR